MADEQRRHQSHGDPHGEERRDGFLARLNALETIVLAAILLTGLAGLMLIGKGVYMKATDQRPDWKVQLSFNDHQLIRPQAACRLA